MHATAKWMLYWRITDAIAAGENLPVKWNCQLCTCRHDGNLLKRAAATNLEKNLPDSNIRPDLWLSVVDGNPCALIEIVDSHDPEPHTTEYAQENRLPLLEFHVREAADLDKIQRGDLFPDSATMPPVCACRAGKTDRQWCPTCDDCFRPLHHHCQYCHQVEEQDNPHRRCPDCGECFWRTDDPPGIFGGLFVFEGRRHKHCRDCGDKFYRPTELDYHRFCSCCYVTNLHNLPRCSQRGLDHSHCQRCGKAIKSQYEICWICKRTLDAETRKEREEAEQVEKANQEMRKTSEPTPLDAESLRVWRELNEWFASKLDSDKEYHAKSETPESREGGADGQGW